MIMVPPSFDSLTGAARRRTGVGSVLAAGLMIGQVLEIGFRSCELTIETGMARLIEYFEDRSVELFNLVDDVGERQNLASMVPVKVEELHARRTA